MKTTGNTILITGGGTGIGEALAHRFHDLGNTVIIAGRRMETLEKAAGDRLNIHALTLDQDDPASVSAFAEKLVTDFPDVNVLFNSAGIMRMETSLDKFRDLSDAEASVTSNLLGPIRVTNALIEHLGRQPDAVIVNVSSGLAFVPLVIAPTYSAIKAAIHSYTESLRAVLKGSFIDSSPFEKAQHREIATIDSDGQRRWAKRLTEAGEPLDAHFEENIRVSERWFEGLLPKLKLAA